MLQLYSLFLLSAAKRILIHGVTTRWYKASVSESVEFFILAKTIEITIWKETSIPWESARIQINYTCLRVDESAQNIFGNIFFIFGIVFWFIFGFTQSERLGSVTNRIILFYIWYLKKKNFKLYYVFKIKR